MDGGAIYVFFGPDLVGDYQLADAPLVLTASGASSHAGSHLARGDVNGDGLSDLLVGSYGNDLGAWGAGAVYVVLAGTPRGLLSLDDADAILHGTVAGEGVGTSVGSADVNGDGFADLVVGAPGASSDGMTMNGAVYVVHGPVSGVHAVDLVAASRLGGSESDERVGARVAGVPDLDGDGNDHVVVGSREVDATGTDSGVVYIMASPLPESGNLADAPWKVEGESAGDEAGASIAAAGDIDQDGLGDVLVGAPGHDGVGAVYTLTEPPLRAGLGHRRRVAQEARGRAGGRRARHRRRGRRRERGWLARRLDRGGQRRRRVPLLRLSRMTGDVGFRRRCG